MMTSLISSMNVGLDQRQMVRRMQFKAGDNTAAEQLQAEDVCEARVSTTNISVGKSPMNLKLFYIRQAADGGILRPVLLEMMDMLSMDPDMPRTRDLVRQAEKIEDKEFAGQAKETENAEPAGRSEKTENAKHAEAVDLLKASSENPKIKAYDRTESGLPVGRQEFTQR